MRCLLPTLTKLDTIRHKSGKLNANTKSEVSHQNLREKSCRNYEQGQRCDQPTGNAEVNYLLKKIITKVYII